MRDPARPAAYIRADPGADADALAGARQAVSQTARQRGWPEPVIYTDEGLGPAGSSSPALDRLAAAVIAGRHDALFLAGPGVVSGSVLLMRLLLVCTKNGVSAELLAAAPPAAPPAGLRADTPAVRPARATGHAPPFPLPRDPGSLLTRARLEALDELFPDWRIWLDHHGWHARRRASTYLQHHRRGFPVFCVHGRTSVELAAQLCWQRAADLHPPTGRTA